MLFIPSSKISSAVSISVFALYLRRLDLIRLNLHMVCQFQRPLILYSLVGMAQDSFLAYTPEQHPIVLQIGGSNLENLAKATELANAYSYDEINFKFVPLFLPFY